MQVYIYICWQLELSGNANLRLYQCWFAFTYRSPIKKFASCRLREKNFASLRLRKNLVELRARLSLLVDKTTFQYRALTICCTTIGRHAPPAPAAVAEGTPWTCRITHHHQHPQPWGGKGRPGRAGPPPPAPHDAGKWDALDVTGSPPAAAAAEGWAAPGSAHRHPRRGGRGRGALCRILPSASAPRGKGRPGRAGIATTSAASRGGSKNRRVYARLFYFLVKNQCIIFCHLWRVFIYMYLMIIPLDFQLLRIRVYHQLCAS